MPYPVLRWFYSLYLNAAIETPSFALATIRDIKIVGRPDSALHSDPGCKLEHRARINTGVQMQVAYKGLIVIAVSMFFF
ncbi:hypothetical protein NWF32_24980 [Pseudomonas qingdaonensis]|nr:hypothetical protein [Pseudomonas qingdaonensis]